MAIAIETRDVLSKLDGVIRVHPNGLNGHALVYVKDKKAFTAAMVQEALAKTEKLRLRKMESAKA